jgi:hypothetical protein
MKRMILPHLISEGQRITDKGSVNEGPVEVIGGTGVKNKGLPENSILIVAGNI